MNTKEAIMKVTNKYEGWMGYAGSQKEVDKLRKERDNIIEFLQRGEKYEKIIETVKEFMGEYKRCELFYRENFPTRCGKFLYRIMTTLQKYFPKDK